jgi:hypothetical protein
MNADKLHVRSKSSAEDQIYHIIQASRNAVDTYGRPDVPMICNKYPKYLVQYMPNNSYHHTEWKFSEMLQNNHPM